MKKFLFLAIVAGLLAGCSRKDRLVEVSKVILPKTVDIQVSGIMEIPVLTLKVTKKGLEFGVEMATVPVRVEGAGVFVSQNNHILTCGHLFWLKEVTSITVCNNSGTCTAGELLAHEDRYDLALIRGFFDEPTPYAKVARPGELEVGEQVLAVGSPLGFPFSVSHGIVSALGRDNVGVENMTQSDTFLNPGNSGGPLFNLRGEIVGINSRIVPPVNANIFTGLGFSVESRQIIDFLGRFRRIDQAFPNRAPKWYDGFLNAIGYKN